MNFNTTRTSYENLCEEIFKQWLVGSLNLDGLDKWFDVAHCPEPYLDFEQGTEPLLVVTHNPGQGIESQLKINFDSDNSPLRTNLSYMWNSRALASWYGGDANMRISAAAKNRIIGLRNLANGLKADGLRQIELFPLHSRKRPPDRYLYGSTTTGTVLDKYHRSLRRYIDESPIVVGLSGSAPFMDGKANKDWAHALGLDLQQTQCLVLKERNGRPTVGIFYHRSFGRLRILFCRQGSNGLPSSSDLSKAIEAL